jgi:hypothetical protein
VTDALFTQFHKEHRPLSGLLGDESRTAIAHAHQLTRAEAESNTDHELVGLFLKSWHQFAKPIVRVEGPVVHNEPGRAHRTGDGSIKPMYWRWFYRFPLQGNVKLLEYWPEGLPAEPCGNSLDFEPAPDMVWIWGNGGVPCVVLDVPHDEDPDGDTPPRERVLNAVRFLDQAVSAANAELAAFDRKLREDLLEVACKRRSRLGAIAQKHTEMIELLAREAPPLCVEVEPVADQPCPIPTPYIEVDGEPVALDITVTEATFSGLIDICQQWAESAQSYPGAFSQLDEDSVTSLLVATLNVVFDTAQREVFKGKGKTDIFVEGRRGDRSHGAYIGEAKYWDGPKGIPDHFDQLLGNAIEQLRHVLLVYYVRAKRIDAVRENARATIERLPIFNAWKAGDSPSIALVEHPQYGHSVEVAVLFVHMPK